MARAAGIAAAEPGPTIDTTGAVLLRSAGN
jgi:hypothetical protein